MGESPDALSPVKRALAELRELRARLEQAERERTEPIAIVGHAGRFPGGLDIDGLWELLRDGRDAIVEVPGERWDAPAFYDEDPDAPGKMYTRRGGFLPRVDLFDAHFFGVSPREAASMDPQQRLLLETTWQALEHAAIAPARLAGTETGVFIGLSNIDYYRMAFGDRAGIDAYYGSGTSGSVAAGRISYVLGLRGPSLVVDTACSSSLVATHLACQSLRNRECEMALAGGVNLILSPDINIACSKARMMAPDGLCKTFDARADGYVRSEGCAVVVLKRLTDAQRDGDRILALIRGSAVNQDGRSSGLTVPNGPAQEAVIRRALEIAGVEPGEIAYVEAHGTGTALGDPIEVRALARVFADRAGAERLAIGSIKANVGHLEAAAGIAGLVKVVLAIDRGALPGHPHLGDRNPYLDWDSLPLTIQSRTQPWPVGERRRIAGVSSFGFSGTNAHVIVEEPPAAQNPAATAERTRHLLTMSARTPEALDALAADYGRFLAADGLCIGDVCMSANAGRSHFEHRIAIVGESPREIGAALAEVRAGRSHARGVRGTADPDPPEPVFLFTGQGAQYAGMGRVLYDTQPAFRRAIDRCDALLRGTLERPLLSAIFPESRESTLIDQTAYTQPALFALEYALSELWRSWGIAPSVLMGHSVGELVAGCVAGVFSLEDGLALVAARGRLMQSLPSGGAMAAVLAGFGRVEATIAHDRQLAIAAINGPENTVISGPAEAVEPALERLGRDGVKAQRLTVSHAFHSPLMEPMLDEFERIAKTVAFGAPRVPIVSNLTGDVATPEDLTSPGYWRRHAREAVRFEQGIETLRRRGHRVFVEIGPTPTLLGLARRVVTDDGALFLPSLRKGRDDWEVMLGSLGQLYVKGAEIDWAAFDRDYVRRRVTVPGYPFQRQRYWLDVRRAQPDIPETSEFAGAHPADAPHATESLYEITWQEHPRPVRGSEATHAGDAWVVLADRSGVASAIADRLRARGDSVVMVRSADAVDGDGALRLDPARPEQFVRLAQDVGQGPRRLRGILHLWSLDVDRVCESSSMLAAAQQLTCRSLLHLVRALAGEALASPPPRLWVVTRGAQPIGDDVSPAQAPVWGMCSVVSVEHPELEPTCIDLDQAPGASDVEALWAELEAGDAEDRVVFRGDRRYVARLIASAWRGAAEEPQLEPHATYLVTGGLGGLGLRVARRLVEGGARNLVLVARRHPSEAAEAVIRDLTNSGCRVVAARADVSREADVRVLMEEVAGTLPPLKGIIHAAGVLDDGVLVRQDWERFEKVLAPKLAGAWHLHAASEHVPLDFFILFSSGAAFFGSAGQSNYAAANSFLDALAHYRRAKGLPATSINWGPWADTGMTVASDHRERWEKWGLKLVEPEAALDLLARMLRGAPPQIAVLPLDRANLAERLRSTRRPALLAGFADRPPARVRSTGDELARELEAAPARHRRAIVSAHVCCHVREVLGLEPDFELNPRQGLRDLGMDSLMAVELRGRLQTAVGRPLSATIAFDHPTVDALTDHLAFAVLGLDRTEAPEIVEGRERREPSADPIAVIGVGCRMPGGADTPEALWRLLRDGVDGISEVPRERWDADVLNGGDGRSAGEAAVRWGGFLRKVDEFDPHFFGIAPREAVFMDPQQRLLLEVSWEALEHAAQAPDQLAQTRTGVFIGISTCDYGQLLLNAQSRAELDAYMSTGNAPSVAAGRLAYVLGLQGPAMAVDTACSSSLVAVHLACRSLRTGECRIALAGGVNLLLLRESTIILSKAGMLSPDGRCKTFDAAADGYVRGDGCGMVVLKRLSDAQADGDRILAVIRGTAINHDGRSSGLTVPNGPAQEAVIRDALADGQVAPSEVSYIEAHGTGTALGDPIELQALRAVLGEGRGADRPLVVGSVKTNIGHLESAAGIAGLIKVVLALEHGEIPPHLHFRQWNPHIALEGFPAVIPTARMAWPAGSDRRIAGVSSFGFSGTNAHVVLEAAPSCESDREAEAHSARLLPLSARSETALRALAAQYAEHIANHPEIDLADLCHTAGAGRSHLSNRLALLADSGAEAISALQEFAAGRPDPRLVAGASGRRPPDVAFLFTGQGSQYTGMARELYDHEPAFRRPMDRCAELLQPHVDVPLLSILDGRSGDGSLLEDTAYAQPALFALEYALTELWRSWGVVPAALIGHSLGECVAACVAGVFSLEDGLKLVAARGRLMQQLSPEGEMFAVRAPEERVRVAIASAAGTVVIAAVNGPEDVVIAGRPDAVRAAAGGLEQGGLRTRRLPVSRAFHSPLMDPVLTEFEAVAREIRYSAPQTRLVSNVTGRLAGNDVATAAYWTRHVRDMVRFRDGIETLAGQGHTLFVEVGPQPTLLLLAQRCAVNAAEACWLASLRKGRRDHEQMLGTLAALYTRGVDVNWSALTAGSRRRKLPLPTYPFERQRYWAESIDRRIRPPSPSEHDGDLHPLLGHRVDSPARETLFEQRISTRSLPYLADHVVFGSIVFPATGYLEIASAAAAHALGQGLPVVRDLVISEPLMLSADKDRSVQVVLSPDGSRAGSFQFFSRADGSGEGGGWRLHASATVMLSDDGLDDPADSLSAIRARCLEPVATIDHYERFERSGITYGPVFRGISELWRGDGEAVGAIQLPETMRAEGYVVHPALLDSCFHVLLAAFSVDTRALLERHVYLPVGVERMRIRGVAGTRALGHARLRPMATEDPEAVVGDLRVFDDAGRLVAEIEGLTAKRANAEALRAAVRTTLHDPFYEIAWEAKPVADVGERSFTGTWLILADRTGLGTALGARLRQAGARALVAESGETYDIAADGIVRLNPGDPDHMERLVGEASRDGIPLEGVVHLWSLDAEPTAETGIEAIDSALHRTCGSLLHLTQRLAARPGPRPRLWVVTRGATTASAQALGQNPAWGLARTIAAEHLDLGCVCIDLDSPEDADECDRLWVELAAPDGEDWIAFRQKQRHVARLRRTVSTRHEPGASSAPEQPVQLAVTTRGILDDLQLQPLTRRAPGAGEVEIEVAAAGLNFRDVLNALGMYPGEPPLGSECVGRVAAVGPGVTSVKVGDDVLGMVEGGLRSFAVAPVDWIVPKPPALGDEEAATIPIAFLTAEYALNRLASVAAGERVLIHAAAGGVGLAAVQLAQRAGAEIFATAGSAEKRAFLESIGVQHVMSSRSLEFADGILARTGGKGVDVVLNSLSGDFIPKSLAALGPGGRFLEIGKRGIWTPAQVADARPHVAYFPIYLGDVPPAQIQEMLRALVGAFTAGELQPLPRRAFPLHEAVAAFRYMAQARHTGKVVLVCDRRRGESDAASAGAIRPQATYLITGGLGGLGLRVARALVDRGARHLVLMGRHGPSDAARDAIHDLERAGATVVIAQGDVACEEDVVRVLHDIAAHLPPLAGVIHAAGVLDDGVITEQEWGRFEKVLAPKVAGAWHLHRHTERLALNFFILFSSTASLIDTPGQGSYAAANAFLDALARYRRAQGLAALSINWGPWAQVGMAARLDGRDRRRWIHRGVQLLDPEDGIAALERLLDRSGPQVAVLAADWRAFAERVPERGRLSLIAELAPAPASPAPEPAAAGPPSLVAQLEHAAEGRRRDVVISHVREQVRQVLALDPTFTLDLHQGLRDIGMDSLMALELRNRLQRSVGRSLPATVTFDRPTVAALADYLAGEVLLLPAAAEGVSSAPQVREQAAPGGAEAIAVIGIGCRMPGGADTPEAFWRLLQDGVDAIREVPRDRWDVDAYYDADPDAPGKMYTRFGGFLDHVDEFDPQFFGISPREALSLDPQQRLLLEVSWEALEHAGQSPDRLMGAPGGVFVGIGSYDYALLQMKLPNPAQLDAYFGTGSSLSVAAGRLSYVLGLQGPALAVDTACSSSLVAVHLACRSLRSGECCVALAGGVNLVLAPEPSVNFCRARMLAADGRCKTFDAAADGYVRGDGCGMVVLKRLSDAQADGDRILAVIRGTAINHDGRSSGLTVPNGPAQEAVIRDALADGQVAPGEVSYVEVHGTGTALGDPIELQALRAVLGEGRGADRPLVVGSVKTNIGHLESAAGIAGLIKVALALEHGEIPPHLHFRRWNPHIALDGFPVVIPTARLAWPAGVERRIAGVSSFGFSGTNAHVVVEAAPPPQLETPAALERPLHVLTLSAKTDAALEDLARRCAEHFTRAPETSLADAAFTTNAGRAQFVRRLAITASTALDARDALIAYAASQAHPAMQRSGAFGAPTPEIAFLFTGQGAQYAGMARQLYETQPVFRDALARCDEILRPYLDAPLLSALYASDPAQAAQLDRTGYTQPALFAVEYALAELWQSWGVRPAAVLGHSVGEYVAACVAGVFSLETGLKLIASRARLMQALPPGAMAAVAAPAEQVFEAIRPFPSLSIAAVNGSDDTVISGGEADVEAALRAFEAARVRAQRLKVSHAFHSVLMEPMLDEFERIARDVAFVSPRIPLVSNLTGGPAGPEITTAQYWRRHAREPVQFAAGIRTLLEQGCTHFVEIGPKPTLVAMARQSAPEAEAVWMPSLRPPRGEWAQMLESLATLYVAGAAIDWAAFDRPYQRRCVAMPTYPFQRERFWIEADAGESPPARKAQVFEAIVAAGTRQSEEGPLDLALHTYPAKWQSLERLTTGYIIATLRDLGAFARAGDSDSLDTLLQRAGILPSYRRLIAHWLARLVSEGVLVERDGFFVSETPLPDPCLDALWEASQGLDDLPYLVDWVRCCGTRLKRVITGAESPLETLFPGGSLERAEGLYERSAPARYISGITRAVIAAYVSARPEAATLKVLEIGAGTGSTTSGLLDALPADRTAFWFTDVSEFFLARAEEKLKRYEFVRYALLDIEQSPQSQGFPLHAFDIVVAGNVLHATSDLSRSLEHTRDLLAPGGLLVLPEHTAHLSFFDITIGLIEGWHRYDDEIRADNPLLSADRWQRMLRDVGFEHVAVLPPPGTPPEALGQCVLVCQAPSGAAASQEIDEGALDAVSRRGVGAVKPADPRGARDERLRRLHDAVPTEREELLIEYVRDEVAAVLRLTAAARPDPRQRLMELGLDSLMAIELRNRLASGLDGGVKLPATLMFDYPTIESIAGYLGRQVLGFEDDGAGRQAHPSGDARLREAAAQLEQLSEEEAEALLLQKLESL